VGKSLNFIMNIMRKVENRPALIRGAVMSFIDLNQELPNMREASSSSGLICLRELLINKKDIGKPLTIYPTKKIHKVPYNGSGGDEKQIIKPKANATAGNAIALVFKNDKKFLPGIVVLSTIQAIINEKMTANIADPTPKIKLFLSAMINPRWLNPNNSSLY